MNIRSPLHSLLSAVCGVVIFYSTVMAAPSTTPQESHDRAQRIVHSVLSPFCPGRLLSDCPSTSARELKEKILQKISEGASDESVYEFLYATYGDDIRSTPSTSGIGAIAWFMPAVFVLGGLVLIIVWLSFRRNKATPEVGTNETISEDLKQRIEREISGK